MMPLQRKRFLPKIIGIVLVSAGCICFAAIIVEVVFAANVQKLHLLNSQIGLTEAKFGSESNGTVTIRNDGWNTIQISDISSTCGCTGARLDRRSLRPGQSAVLSATVTIQPGTPLGHVADITLSAGGAAKTKWTIPVSLLSVEDAAITPPFIDFGSIEVGELPAARRACLVIRSSSPLGSTKFEWRGLEDFVAVQEVARDSTRGEVVFEFLLHGPVPDGRIRGEAVVEVRDADSRVLFEKELNWQANCRARRGKA
jgi:hypothetical protein